MRLSIVVCTHNGCGDLERGLPPLIAQVRATTDSEIIAVDNASTDGTAALLDHLSDGCPRFSVHRERELGLSHARNRGYVEAKGAIVAYLDDDAVVHPNWVAEIQRPFRDAEVGAVGGRIMLVWPSKRPAWLPYEYDSMYSGLDRGSGAASLELPVYPIGANMAIRKELLEEVGGFDTQAGRRGASLASNEERILFERLSGVGSTMMYAGSAVVDHYVRAGRDQVRWALRRAWSQGCSDSRLQPVLPARQIIGSARPRYLKRDGDRPLHGLLRGAFNTVGWLGFFSTQHIRKPEGL